MQLQQLHDGLLSRLRRPTMQLQWCLLPWPTATVQDSNLPEAKPLPLAGCGAGVAWAMFLLRYPGSFLWKTDERMIPTSKCLMQRN